MKAIIYKRYGAPDVLSLAIVRDPELGPEDVLVRVRFASIASGDVRVRSLNVPTGFKLLSRLAFGITGPRKPILGTECSGTVVGIGAKVHRFQIGDPVICFPGVTMGAHAQLFKIHQDGRIIFKPSEVSYEQGAALCFGGSTALTFLRDTAKIQQGERLLIIGASGAVGSSAVQLGRFFGAHVTGVASQRNFELIQSLGCHEVVDSNSLDALADLMPFDVILECVGRGSFTEYQRLLKNSQSRLILAAGSIPQMLEGIAPTLFKKARVIPGFASESRDDMTTLCELAMRGIYQPLIDQIFPIENFAEAHAYVDLGRKRGSVLLDMDSFKINP